MRQNKQDMGFFFWAFLIVIFAINSLGVGNEFGNEQVLTWILLSLIGWELTRLREGICGGKNK